MSGPVETARIAQFGPFEANLLTGELRKHGIRIHLGGQPGRVLAALLEHPGQTITREELRRRLWADNTFVEFETGLNSAVKKLREALGDSAGKSVYVETLPRVGYRFVASVQTETPASESVRPEPARTRKAFGGFAPTVVTCAVAVLVFAVYGLRHSKAPVAASSQILVAVLPFQNLTGDPAQEYFSDGLTQEMIAQLGRADSRHLGVIGWTSMMRYKQQPESLKRVGSELGVRYVLEGSVRRAGNRVRITSELIQTKDQTPVWSGQFDRDTRDLLDLQAEITQQIADEIGLTFTNKKPAPRGSRPQLSASGYEAYDLCLRGRYFWNRRNLEGLRQATTYFQQAIDKDPGYARGYTGLADTYAMMAAYGFVAASGVMPKAREAALKALQIDESLAEAHTSLAMIEQNYDWDSPAAEKEFRRAIELDPNYATAHHWYSELLALQGRFDEALAESERARQLDPLSMIIAADNAAVFYFSRQYDRAIERFHKVLEMDPTVLRARLIVAAYTQKGDFRDAFTDLDVWRNAADGPGRLAWYAYVRGRAGDTAEAKRALHQLEETLGASQLDPAQFRNIAYAGIGDKEVWLSWLETACRERTNIPTGFKVDPIYDPLRKEVRFQQMISQVHFTPTAD